MAAPHPRRARRSHRTAARSFDCATLLLYLLIALAASACKSAESGCPRQYDLCLKRCEVTGANPKPVPGAPVEDSRSLCERNCQACRPEAAPAPQGRPTLTGTEPPPVAAKQ